MSDTLYRPADTDNDILRKILLQVGGLPTPGDFDNSIYRKILAQLGGTFRPGDGTSELLRKIAVRVGAGPLPGDTTNKLLYRIDQSLDNEPRPGDYDNALLRKWLSPNALQPTPGTVITIIPKVNPPATQSEVTVLMTGGDSLVGSWLGFWVLEYATPQQNITANYQLKATQLVTAMPFSITFSIPVPSTIPSTVCVAIVKGPTQASVSSSPIKTKGAYKQCFSYPTGFIVVNFGSAPAAPVATASTALAETSFSANWGASSGTTSYRLDVSTSNTFASFVAGFNDLNVGNVLTQSVTGLTGGTTYYFRVRAVNGFGTSANSNSITTLTVPAAPVATASTSLAETSFSANWNAATGASSYRLDVSVSNTFASFVTGFNDLNVGNVVTASVTGLTGGTTYYLRVRAVDASGTSANSNSITTLTVPAAPVTTAASSVAETSFAANWNSSTGASSYRLDVSTVNNFASFVTGYNDLNVGNVTTASVTGLTAATTYYFRVRAVNASGTSANSNTTSQDTLAAAPVATAATSVTDVSFSANWGAVSGATSYRLDVSTVSNFASFVTGYNDLNTGNVVTASVTGLTQNTTYYFRVRVVTSGGTSGNSNTITTLTYFTETLDWVTRVVGNGGTVSQGTKDAANTFLVGITSAGVRSLIYRLNLYAGTGLSACAVPFIKDKGSTLDSFNNFVSGDYSESTGLTGNGTTKSLNTGLVPSTDYSSANSTHLAVYERSAGSESAWQIGCVTSGNTASQFELTIRYAASSNVSGGRQFCTAGSFWSSDSTGLGFYQVIRTSSTALATYHNGSSVATATPSDASRPSVPVFVHALNDSSLGAQSLSARTLAGYSIGLAMDSTQSLAYYNAWQAFQTALGRNV